MSQFWHIADVERDVRFAKRRFDHFQPASLTRYDPFPAWEGQ